MKLHSPEIEALAAESKALTAALSCVEGDGDRKAAVDLVRQVFHRMSTDDLEDWVIKVAMCRILGEPWTGIAPVKVVQGADWQFFEIVARSWVSWVHGDINVARELLDHSRELPRKQSVHGIALGFWQHAIEALVERESAKARKLFRRAAEFGAQYGTESNPPVQWSYAASFFHVPSTSS
jgi:hypothetical protein